MAEKITLARPYARAAFELARQHRELQKWSDMLSTAATVVSHAEVFPLLTSPHISAEERAAYRDEWSQPGAFTAMAEWYRAHYSPDLLNPDIPLDLPKTDVPIRYIHGTNDFAFVEELAESNEPFVDGPYDHVLIDSSHWMLHERPAEMAELISSWLLAD